ncbi:MAG: hypothetical protein ACRYFS_16135 [Janthinobacterium lividum]
METLTADQSNWRQLLDKPRVYADLNGGGRIGDKYIVPLNSRATEGDLRLLGHVLMPGLVLNFWTDDGDDECNPDPLLFQATVQFDEDTQKWVAIADWNGFYHASKLNKSGETQPSGVLTHSSTL